MTMAKDAALMTADEFEVAPVQFAELIRGRMVVREPPTDLHGAVVARLIYLLGAYVYPRRAGVVMGEAGFRIESHPDTVRAPDIAFVSGDRDIAFRERGFGAYAPDLAIEVRAPTDRSGELIAKVADWLRAGVHIVWVVDPVRGSAQIYDAGGDVRVVSVDGTLDGGDVLPGFVCMLADALDTGRPMHRG